jgi:LysM repeat protein
MKKTIVSLGAILAATSAMAAIYTVKSGDTMKNIATAHGLEYAALRDMNTQISNPNLIYPGQKLNIGDEQTIVEKAVEYVADVVEPAAAAKKCDGNAACKNVINGNPMYRPAGGHFYSVTTLQSDTSFKPYVLNEVLGYGITDGVSIWLDTTASTSDSFKEHTFGWNSFGGGLSVRYLNDGNWKGDVYGKVIVDGGEDWWHEDTTNYTWTAGTKLGYSSCWWTLNGLFEYDYSNFEGFNWGDIGGKTYRAGIEGQLVFNKRWNTVATVIYNMPEITDNGFEGKLGLNYNISNDMYVGAYVAQEIVSEKEGELDEETTLGLQFGIDF